MVCDTWTLDGPICANHLGVPELNPLILRIARFGVLNIANRRFEAIRTNRSNITKIFLSEHRFERINWHDSRCESPGHLSPGLLERTGAANKWQRANCSPSARHPSRCRSWRQFGEGAAGITGEFQVTVCGVTVCPFSRHKGNQRPKRL